MDDPSALRRKAARFFEEAEKLNEVGRQLELWANDLEEIDDTHQQIAGKSGKERRRRTDWQPRQWTRR
jgi:hypothetical protein